MRYPDGFEFFMQGKVADGVARREGRSPDRREGSSRSKRRAALVETGFLKLSRGCFGGDARGAEKGAKPHNRPRLAARRAGGPNKIEEKAFVPAGQHKPISIWNIAVRTFTLFQS